jgi:hypothetical protein
MTTAARLDHLLLRMEIGTNAVQQAPYLEGKDCIEDKPPTTFHETPRFLPDSQEAATLPHFEPRESVQHNHILSFKRDFNVTVAFTLKNSTWSVISDITAIRLLQAPTHFILLALDHPYNKWRRCNFRDPCVYSSTVLLFFYL